MATEKQALQSLMGVLPDCLVEILGVNKCQLSWSLVLESLQQPLINRVDEADLAGDAGVSFLRHCWALDIRFTALETSS